MPAPPSVPTAAPRLVIAWATTLAALLVATLPLWTPLRAVPRVAPFGAPPAVIEFALLAAIGLGLLFALDKHYRGWWGAGIATIALATLMAFDQLRWQPWAYHALLVGTVLATSDARRAMSGLRMVTIAVYAFSAIAKLDAEFVATLGQQMVGVLLSPVGIDPASLRDGLANAAALSLPIGELSLAVLLAASTRWRRLAKPVCVLVALMHATTIAVLGPWGLAHSLGVLVWNAGFAWQTVVLFGPPLPCPEKAEARFPLASIATVVVLSFGVLMPLGTLLGLWDRWPGWALYAPGGERAQLLVRDDAAPSLPESLLPHVEGIDDWRRVHLDDWTLEQTWAPIYPQNRVIAAMVVGLIERGFAEDDVRVVVESTADRWTRKRTAKTLRMRYQMEPASQLLGSVPAVAWK